MRIEKNKYEKTILLKGSNAAATTYSFISTFDYCIRINRVKRELVTVDKY